ncbi:MAG: hypothetical protein U9Q22_05495 [Candidatus Altiarchaeota archaeon]|nr:hypothetical protein [Candidatus Altiarchaeota archaeon]
MKTIKNRNIKGRIFVVCMIMVLSVMTTVVMSTAVAAGGSSSFATEVVSSNGPFGSSPYDDPNAVLGKPTTKWKDSWTSPPDERAKLVEAAWNVGLNDEPLITSLNEGSQITVKFDHQVMDDPDNPYGIDLLVFGNSFFAADSWVSDETNMNTCMITGGVSEECIQVSVSQDNQSWYTYESGPHGDEKFPTQAYMWDRENAQWTDIEMDWTKPVDPSLTDTDFISISTADAIDLYDGSAGGTGFDLAESGYEWIQYVRIEGVPGCCGGEIDGFADVAPLTSTTTSTTSTTTSSTTTLIIRLRIEGSNHTIWNEDMTVPESAEIHCYNSGNNYIINGTSVLVALDSASELGGFDYTVSDKWYPSMGFYMDSISGEMAGGMDGWMYRVDYYSTVMSSENFMLDETNEEVLWYWGTFGEGGYPIRISVDKTRVNVSDTITVEVTYFDETEWLPLADATVHADTDYLTDENGTVKISIENPGDYSIFAEKSGYIRSDKITVEVEGTQESAQVMLSATIIPAISFSVTPDSLDFGEIGVGCNKAGDGIYITNEGSWDINVTAEVEDSSASGLYSNGLYLWGVIWNQFSTVVPHDISDWSNTMGPYSTELKVPLNYTGVGPQNGTLTLWAEGVPP